MHAITFLVAIPSGILLIVYADRPAARVGAAIYAASLLVGFGTSAAYHRLPWSPPARRRMQRLDHSMIFVLIAGTYTPICLIALGGVVGTAMLVSVWIGAVAGIVLAAVGIAERRFVGGVCYVALGWAVVAAGPFLVTRLTAAQLALIVVGGVIYTVGVVLLGARRPNPFPRVFGYHEVWHVLVVAAAICHFLAIELLVSGA
jgi:hemolysin III